MADKILLILDIDETLLFATQNKLDYPPHHLIWPYHIYLRPFFYSFLEKVQCHFDLAIWSSASDKYVEAIVNTVIPEVIDLKFAWGRSRCTPMFERIHEGRYHPDTESGHHLYRKKLKKVKRTFKHPLEQMLIVDDSPDKCKDNYGNAIYIKAFEGDQEDTELLKLTDYLISLKDEPNVRTIEKRGWEYVELGV